MDHRQIVRIIAVARIVLGSAILVAPGAMGRRWVGAVAADRGTKLFARTMGARDVALGLGTLRALERGEPSRGWVAMSGLADAADAAATVLAAPAIGWRRAVPVVLVASGSAALGTLAVNEVD